MTKQIVCCDCGKFFQFTDKQQKEYEEKSFCEPRRCKNCKNLMKELRNSPYFGIEEVMRNNVSLRKRRQRVHYPPHIVGGFR